MARGLSYGLTEVGYDVILADNGEAALEMVSKIDHHIILLDLRLPGMSGFDVCRQLRMEGYRQPILMLTALDDELDKIVGLELGAAGSQPPD